MSLLPLQMSTTAVHDANAGLRHVTRTANQAPYFGARPILKASSGSKRSSSMRPAAPLSHCCALNSCAASHLRTAFHINMLGQATRQSSRKV